MGRQVLWGEGGKYRPSTQKFDFRSLEIFRFFKRQQFELHVKAEYGNIITAGFYNVLSIINEIFYSVVKVNPPLGCVL